ncbi:MAG: hypothetical protein AB7G75_16540 [Candidatus Binatia bacterium]
MVYIAARLREAQQVEQVLCEQQVDYMVDREPYEVKLLGILPIRYDGVAFYVLAGQAESCRRALRDADLLRGLVEKEPE